MSMWGIHNSAWLSQGPRRPAADAVRLPTPGCWPCGGLRGETAPPLSAVCEELSRALWRAASISLEAE